MYCTKCGREIADSCVSCTYCGASTSDEMSAPSGGSNQYQQSQPSVSPYIHEDTSPLSMSDYLIMLLLICIPVVNVIMLCVWSFSMDANVNKRNFARAYLIVMLIGIVLAFLMWGSMIGLLIALSQV